MKNNGIDIKLCDNIDSAQFFERFPDEIAVQDFCSEIDGVTRVTN